MKIETIHLSVICKEKSFRFDINFILKNLKYNFENSIPFSDLFEIINKQNVDTENLDEFQYSEISDVNNLGEVFPNQLDYKQRSEFNENYFKKIDKGDIILPKTNDILISSVRPNLKKFVFVTPNDNIYYTKAFIQLRPKNIPEILYYSIRNIFFDNLIIVSRQGKGYPTLKTDDLKYIKFEKKIVEKLIDKKNELLKAIRKINTRIKNLRSQIKPDKEIINEIFTKEFGWNIENFNELKKIKVMNINLDSFTNNIDVRFSFKFHNKAGKYITQVLKNQNSKRIKDFLSEDITLGKGISPSDYDESGTHFYVSMADIKKWKFDTFEAKTVSESYFEKNINKRINQNDIIMARSGEGTIGKVAIISSDDFEGIYSDFTMRVRLKNYNPVFLYYFFRTDYFQYLIYSHKKGLGNNTNIFPSQIKEFPIPDLNEKQQGKILEEIQSKINKQRDIENKINLKHKEFARIIEEAIKENAESS